MNVLERCAELTTQTTENSNPAIASADFVPRGAVDAKDGSGGKMWTSWFFTQRKQWLDVIEIGLKADPNNHGVVVASARSFSAAIVPAAIPLALPISMALFWLPFSDMGQNAIHLHTLRSLVRRAMPRRLCNMLLNTYLLSSMSADSKWFTTTVQHCWADNSTSNGLVVPVFLSLICLMSSPPARLSSPCSCVSPWACIPWYPNLPTLLPPCVRALAAAGRQWINGGAVQGTQEVISTYGGLVDERIQGILTPFFFWSDTSAHAGTSPVDVSSEGWTLCLA